MIKSISVTNEREETIRMELGESGNTDFLFLHADGLGPVPTAINMTDLASGDGSFFNNARAQSRTVTLFLQLLENPTIEASRHSLYRYFPSKKPIAITIETEERLCVAEGFVEMNQVNPFSSRVVGQVTVRCPSPYLRSANDAVEVLNGTQNNFEFPLEIEDDGFVFGEIISDPEKVITYEGDVDAGMIFYMRATGEVVDPVFYNGGTKETIGIDSERLELYTGDGIINSDEFLISTIRGNKYAYLIRSGVYWNILNCLTDDPDWLTLTRGENILGYYAESGESNILLQIRFYELYAGV
jgi:phage-related protein